MKRLIRNNVRGFTLLEIVFVTLFLAMIGTYTWTYLRSTINIQKSIEASTEIQQTGISILTRLTDDINQVFIVDSFQKLTLFRGEPNTLTFTSLSHDAPDPNDRESEEAKITYALDSDPNAKDSQTKVLTRKEVPYFTPIEDKDDEYQPLIVAHGIKDLEFSYSEDGTKFVNEWDTTSGDHPNKLPLLVKIAFTMIGEKEREEYFETLIDLPVTEDINAARGSGTGTGGPGGTGGSGTSKPGQPGQNPTGANPNSSNPFFNRGRSGTSQGGSGSQTQQPGGSGTQIPQGGSGAQPQGR